MTATIQLQNVSKILFNGTSALENLIKSLSDERVPNIQESIAKIDPNSPMYDLHAIGLKNLVARTESELENLLNIVSSANETLQKITSDAKSLRGRISEMVSNYEWSSAGSFKKVYLTSTLPFKHASHFFSQINENIGSLKSSHAVIALGALASGYMMGKIV